MSGHRWLWEGWKASHHPGTLTVSSVHMPKLGSLQRHHKSFPPRFCLESWKHTHTEFANIMKPLPTPAEAWANTGKPLCTSAPLGIWRTANPTRPHTLVYSHSLPDIQIPLTIYPLPYFQSQTSLCLLSIFLVVASAFHMWWYKFTSLWTPSQNFSATFLP